MNNERKRALLAELVELSVPPSRQPDDIAKEDYIAYVKQETGESIALTTAHNRLMRMVEAGGWTTLMVKDGRTRRRVWRKVETDDG